MNRYPWRGPRCKRCNTPLINVTWEQHVKGCVNRKDDDPR